MKTYRQISLEEREKIYQLLKADISFAKIAKELGRSKSSISREVRRNSSIKLGYLPDRANTSASRRKNKLDRLIDDKWSPEIIAGRMKHENKEHLISHETIYKYIYSHDGQKLKLYESLMYARPKRQLKFSRRKPVVPDVYKIHNRPDYINARQEFGYFEGDLTFLKAREMEISRFLLRDFLARHL